VSSEGTGSLDPFEGGFAIGLAIETGRIFGHPVATITTVHDRVTLTSVVATSCFAHENTLCPYLYRLTNHGYLLPSLVVVSAKKTQKKPSSLMRLIEYVGKELDFLFRQKLRALIPSPRFRHAM
jgi:hypothetical protein